MKKKIGLITIIIIDVLMGICYLLAYGPIDNFRVFIITSSMVTKEHKYIARTLYSEKTIAKVMSENFIKEIEEDTDTTQIAFEEIKEDEKYDSIYEEQVLKKDEGNDLYKIVELSGSTYKGYMVVIYDPARISLINSSRLGKAGQFLQNMTKENDAILAVNAGGYADGGGLGNGSTPTGTVISNGTVIYRGVDTGWGGGLIGFNKDHVLVLTKDTPEKAIEKGMVDAVDFGPFLIVNGKKAYSKGNGGSGISPRTIISQRKDGIVLFFIIDGRRPGYSLGINLANMTELAYKYGAYNAANMDGGASTILVVDNKIVNRPCGNSATGARLLPNAWAVK